MKCEIERMEINYTFYFFAFLRKMIKKLLTFCYWCGGACAAALRFLPCQFTLSVAETSSVAGRV